MKKINQRINKLILNTFLRDKYYTKRGSKYLNINLVNTRKMKRTGLRLAALVGLGALLYLGNPLGKTSDEVYQEVQRYRENMSNLVSLTSTTEAIASISDQKEDMPKKQVKRNKKNIKIFRWPLDYKPEISHSQNFGRRILEGRMKNHKGIDLSADIGTRVYAAADGKVVYTCDEEEQDCNGYGTNILIRHKDGVFASRYAHLSAIFVDKQEEVAKGQKIGLTGNTGNSTGPHLHYELIRKNKKID